MVCLQKQMVAVLDLALAQQATIDALLKEKKLQ